MESRATTDTGRVVAAGSVRAKFIEFAEVRAEASVYASDGIVQSTVEAGANVEVLGGHGAIVGGQIRARESVSARDIGSLRGVATEIMVGVDPSVFAEVQRIGARAAQLVPQLTRVQQRLTFLQLQHQNRQEKLTAVGRAELERFHAAYRSLLDERAQLALRHKELQGMLQNLRGASVVAQGTCHSEVQITIGSSTHVVRQAWTGVRFQRNDQSGEIEPLAAN